MKEPEPLTADVLAALPPTAIAFLVWQAEQIQYLTARVAELTARVAELENQLRKNSTNSSKPPSSSHPHAKPLSTKPPSPRAQGGQPGHEKHERALLPAEQCQAVIPCLPTECRRCGKSLSGTDPEPLRHQVWEIPDIQPIVTEYQQHRLACTCGCSTCGPLPAGVCRGQGGPRLTALVAMLMACYRQSKRRTAEFLSLILNQPASPGWIVQLQQRASEAVQPAYEELAQQLPTTSALNIDESPTKQGRWKAWVWTFVAKAFTFFACRTSRAAEVLKQLLGTGYEGVIQCDRARMYWAFGRLQWCWAHLKRDFQSWIDSSCTVRKRLGRDLMRPTLQIFTLWQKVRDGTMSRGVFQKSMQPLRQEVEMLLLRGYFHGLTSGLCKDLWKRRENLWIFVDVEGVEPTNNAAERALRHAVIWRKLSFGTQSASGSRFVERMLTVIETCRQQGRNTYTFMVDTLRLRWSGQAGPSLLPDA